MRKVLIVDYGDRFFMVWSPQLNALQREWIEVGFLSWNNPKLDGWDIPRVIRTIKENQIGLVILHFGTDCPRKRAAKIIHQIKPTRVKIVVCTVSPVLYGLADDFIPFPDASSVIHTIKKLLPDDP